MNNDMKNLGVSFILACIVDDLSLTKLSLPIANKTCYLIKSKDEKINHTIFLENEESFNSEEILKELIDYSHLKLTGEKSDCNTYDEDSQNESIVEIGNTLRQYTSDIFKDIKGDNPIANFRGIEKYKKLENALSTLADDLYGEADESSLDFEVFEYGLSFSDHVFGELTIDERTVNKEFTLEEWQEGIETSENFIESMKALGDLSKDELKDLIDEYIDSEDEAYGVDEEGFYYYEHQSTLQESYNKVDDFIRHHKEIAKEQDTKNNVNNNKQNNNHGREIELDWKDSFDEVDDFVRGYDDEDTQEDPNTNKKDDEKKEIYPLHEMYFENEKSSLNEDNDQDDFEKLFNFTESELKMLEKLCKKANDLFGEEKDKTKEQRISDILTGKDDEKEQN